MKTVHCNGLHPGLEEEEPIVIWMMTCAPVAFSENLKVLLREGISKTCPRATFLDNMRLFNFASPKGDRTHKGQYLFIGLSTLSRTHMQLRDMLLHQPGSLPKSSPLVLPWHEPLFLALSTSDVLETPREQRIPEEVSS